MKFLLLLLWMMQNAFASNCRQALAPEALRELKQMQQSIESARDRNEDTIYVQALESGLHRKIAEILSKSSLSRAQLIQHLESLKVDTAARSDEITDTKKVLIDPELIEYALEFARNENTPLENSFFTLIEDHPYSGHDDYENKQKTYLKRLQGFFLIAEHAASLKLNFDINKPIILKLGAEFYIGVDSSRIETSTILHQAISYSLDAEAIKTLVLAGAELNTLNQDGETPLFAACRGNHAEAAEILLNAGADLNITDPSNVTPLHMAADRDHFEISKKLLTHGADVNARTPHISCTLLERALLNESPELVKLFIEHGANTPSWNYIFDLIKYAGFKHTLHLYTGKYRPKKVLP